MNDVIKILIVGTICTIVGTISIAAYTEYRAREIIKDTTAMFEKMNADMERQKQEEQARRQAEIMKQKQQAEEEQARQAEIEQQARETILARQQAEEQKNAAFEKYFKPRAECNDLNLEWSKFVLCKNEKMTAKIKFYKSYKSNILTTEIYNKLQPPKII